MKVLFVLAVVCATLVVAMPPSALSAKTELKQGPAFIKQPEPLTEFDAGDAVVVDVVNLKRKAVILVRSTPTEQGLERRALLRDTWMQAQNKSSPFALQGEDRHSAVVWFYIERNTESPASMVPVEEEGRLHGDILIVNPVDEKADSVDTLGALTRWVRVAYHERFEFVLLVEDDTFVSLWGLSEFLDQYKNDQLFYAGGVNGFESAEQAYHHKYYAPYAERGTIVISSTVNEILARDAQMLTHKFPFDVTLGHYMMTMATKPVQSKQIIRDLKHVYTAVEAPLIIAKVPSDMMVALSTPILVNGKWVTPTLPAQVAEIRTRGMFIDPHPKELEPLCDTVSGKCGKDSLKVANAP